MYDGFRPFRQRECELALLRCSDRRHGAQANAAAPLKNLESALLGSQQQAVIATDPDGNFIYRNRAAEKLYGWSFSEAAGRNIRRTV